MPTILGPGGCLVAANVRVARGPRERMKGLIGGPSLGSRDALVLPGAPQVHTFGMRAVIDVAFCGESGEVLHLIHEMRPHRLSRWVPRTSYSIETAAGALAAIERGDVLELRGL